MTENKKKTVYWICDECGCEVPFFGNDSDTVCPSCGSRISIEKLTQVREELNNVNRGHGVFVNAANDLGQEPVKEDKPDLEIQNGNLVRYSGSESKVEIPSTVTAISPRAFSDCKTIREVTIPDEVTVIPNGAFEDCTNLEKVILPQNLNTIESNAFKGCGKLKEISLSPAIKTIEQDAFRGVGALNYETMFKRPAQYNTSISISDLWLNKKYDEVRGKDKTAKIDLSSKKKIPVFVYAIAAVLLIGLGIFIKSNMDFKNQMETAKAYVSNRDYAKAVEAYQSALRMRSGNEEASTGLNNAYFAWGDSLLNEGKYEEAIKKYSMSPNASGYIDQAYIEWGDSLLYDGRYEEAISQYSMSSNGTEYVDQAYREWGDSLLYDGKYEEAIDKYLNMTDSSYDIANAYTVWSDQLVSEGDYESAAKVLESGKETYPEISGELDYQSEYVKSEQYIAGLKNDLRTIVKKVDEGKFSEALKMIDTLNSSAEDIKANVGSFPLIMDVNGAKYDKVALYKPYSNRFAVYYGEYSENDREGNGMYLYRYSNDAEENRYEYTEGEWKNDKPNGIQNRYDWQFENGKTVYDNKLHCNTDDGIFNGDLLWTDNLTGITYKGTFENGLFKLLDTRPDGAGVMYVVVQTDDGNYLGYNDEQSLSNQWSIYEFGD